MSRQVFSTSMAPDCQVEEVSGYLRVKGWDQPQVAVDANPSEVDIQENEDTFCVTSRSDCEIRLPHGASLKVGTVRDDAQFKLLDEVLDLEAVNGSLGLRNLPGAKIGSVHGDMSARNISGDLEIGQVGGDIDVRQLEGSFRLDAGDGDLDLQQVHGQLSAVVKGDARLRLGDLSGTDKYVEAEGDVRCSLPAGIGVKLQLVSKGKSIRVNLPGSSKNYEQEQVEIEVGGGGNLLEIIAGGDINLDATETSWGSDSAFTPDFGEEIARQVETQIGQQMEEVSRRLKIQMERLSGDLGRVGMSPEETQRIIDHAMRASERETARAQEKMRHAQEKLERKLEDARRRAEQKERASERSAWARTRHSWGREPFTSPVAPQAPAAPKSPVTEEERLMILRMLEQKKISLEEADTLLSALEGKE